MEIEYELRRDDYEHLTRRSFKERAFKLLGPLVLVLTLFLFFASYPRHGLIAALVPIFITMAIWALCTVIFLRYIARATYRTLKKSPSWGKTKVCLEPDCLTSATYLIKNEIRWEAVSRVAEDAKGFYLYLNPVQVVMVPRRVFAGVEEAKAFWALATEYYQYARPATTRAERVRLGR